VLVRGERNTDTETDTETQRKIRDLHQAAAAAALLIALRLSFFFCFFFFLLDLPRIFIFLRECLWRNGDSSLKYFLNDGWFLLFCPCFPSLI
jgi:hypothetical protein